MKKRNLIDSFNYAFEGIIYTVRTQRNMKIHIIAAGLALLAAVVLGLSRLEMAVLLILIGIVFVSELINTAIEATIDTVTTEMNPLAKIAKDVSSAAVLVSAGLAIIVGYLLFFNKANTYTLSTLMAIKKGSIHVTYVSLLLVFILSIIIKAISGHSKHIVRGGMPSVHAAIAFAIATAIAFITQSYLAATLAVIMALLVSETRLEMKVHSGLEILVGALMGIIVTILIFQLAG